MTQEQVGPFQLLQQIAARSQSGGEAATRTRVQPHWTGIGPTLAHGSGVFNFAAMISGRSCATRRQGAESQAFRAA